MEQYNNDTENLESENTPFVPLWTQINLPQPNIKVEADLDPENVAITSSNAWVGIQKPQDINSIVNLESTTSEPLDNQD